VLKINIKIIIQESLSSVSGALAYALNKHFDSFWFAVVHCEMEHSFRPVFPIFGLVTSRIFEIGVFSVFFYFRYTVIGLRDLRWLYVFKIDPDLFYALKK